VLPTSPRAAAPIVRAVAVSEFPSVSTEPVTVLTLGAFELFHVGHVRLLQRAAALGDRLIVGISADAYLRQTKGREPLQSEAERLEIVRSCRYVDDAFVNGLGPITETEIAAHGADVLALGDDWQGRYDHLSRVCRVVYLQRTPEVSTTWLREKLRFE